MGKKRPPAESPTTKNDTSSELHDFVKAEETMQYLRQANRRLQATLAKEKARNEELSEAVYRAARDAASALALENAPRPDIADESASFPTKPASDETALVVVSDLQLAKTTETYNSIVCAERMHVYADKVDNLTAIQRSDHPVRHARLYLLGDIVEGELIFPYQPYAIDSSLYKQVMLDGPQILSDFIRRLLATFETVHVVGVIGNHGQIGGSQRKFHNPTTNADRMLYRFLAELFKGEPRVTFQIPDREGQRDWYAVDYPVGPDHGFLLFHGDQIPGSSAHSVATVARRIYGWASGAVPEPFRYVVYGHWHTSRRYTFNRMTVWCNGSTESTNTWTQEKFAEMAEPEQLLLFVHPKVGVTAEYRVYLS